MQYIYTVIITRADPWIQFWSFINNYSDNLPNMEMRLTNSVDVILAIIWIVVVDDKLDIIDVEASGGDVGGDEDGGAAGLELAQHPLPLLLLLVTVDAHRWPTVFPHQPFQNITSFEDLCKVLLFVECQKKSQQSGQLCNQLRSWD